MSATFVPPGVASESSEYGEIDANMVWDLSPVPTLVVSPSCCITRVSNSAVDKWRRSRSEFVGRDLFDALYGGSPLQRFDRIPLTQAVEAAVSARDFQLCPAAYRSPDGCWWSARIIPVFKEDEILLLLLEWDLFENQTTREEKESTQNMLPVDEMFRLLVHSVKDYAIFLLDTRGYVTTWNTGAELVKGYTRDEIVGKHFSTFYGEDDLQSAKPEKELLMCLRHGRVEDEGWRYRKDGSRFWANVVITAIYRNSVHVGFGKVTRDLTERREGELRLIAAYGESAKLKSDFLANVSHEIRTPMHGLLSACELLLETSLSEDQREIANIIAESGQVQLGVLNGILDYSKLASGSFSITSNVFSVGRTVSSVVRNVQVTLMPGVHIRVMLAPNLPDSAQGDMLRFRQIIQNITDNAAKFTESGHISVHTSVLSEDEASYMILTEITDTGIGVTDAAGRNLFKPFMQFEMTTKKRYQGTGLGLSIAKSLAELMGGSMGYRPNPDCRGSIFWFSVRLNKIASSEQLDTVDARHEAGITAFQGGLRKEHSVAVLKRLQELGATKQLLAVEDNIINQKVLIGMLHSFGLKNIAVAPDGAQAVALMGNSPSKYDLVLMDVSMPVMDGFEATARIRENGILTPIIAMTANALRGYKEKCLESGMDDYISKPVNKSLLLRKLLLWLDPVNSTNHQLERTPDPEETVLLTNILSGRS